jgi:hypothetical protein
VLAQAWLVEFFVKLKLDTESHFVSKLDLLRWYLVRAQARAQVELYRVEPRQVHGYLYSFTVLATGIKMYDCKTII